YIVAAITFTKKALFSACRLGFLRSLKERGLTGVKLIISEKSLGLVESIPDFYPESKWAALRSTFLPRHHEKRSEA
ncbi:MAG: transposase, partial [Synergistaceae bacterium]|nr:transposase [Synergistaceae bacterium]